MTAGIVLRRTVRLGRALRNGRVFLDYRDLDGFRGAFELQLADDEESYLLWWKPLPPLGMPAGVAHTGVLGSIIPACWSFMLAARARGLGTSWTTAHLFHERAVADLLGIPYDDYQQVALIPVAYTIGTDFKPAYRAPASTVTHVNKW